MNDITPFSSSDSEMASKTKKTFVKNHHDMLEKKMKFNCLSLIMDDYDLFRKGSKIPTFVIRPFLNMFNLEVDRISLQQLEYEIDPTDYPVNCNFLKYDTVVTLTSLTQIFNLIKPVI